MCPIWFLNVGVKLLPFIMLNMETEFTKINILSSQLLIFPYVNTDYILVLIKYYKVTIHPSISLLKSITHIHYIVHTFHGGFKRHHGCDVIKEQIVKKVKMGS